MKNGFGTPNLQEQTHSGPLLALFSTSGMPSESQFFKNIVLSAVLRHTTLLEGREIRRFVEDNIILYDTKRVTLLSEFFMVLGSG